MSKTGRLGRYELVRKVAAGGMAEIFLARQWGEAGFFRDVVIKRLFAHLAEHEQQVRMFQDEGRLLAELAHPNIPQVYDVGYDDGYWFIAMEYVEGHTVADLWYQGAKNGVPMPMAAAIGIVIQTCEALHHVHERADRAQRPLRIVHRDVTPHNVMLTRDGVAKLMDFGVALTAARREAEGAVRGTFSYMAPEQIRGRPLDKRADVFALGVILYELTTGTRLYRGSDIQVMTQIVERDAPRPSDRVPGYPDDLEEIVMRTLSRDRAQRTTSAAQLAWRLEEFSLANQLLVGPRSISRFVAQVMPASPVSEEALGIVPPSDDDQLDDGALGAADATGGYDTRGLAPEGSTDMSLELPDSGSLRETSESAFRALDELLAGDLRAGSEDGLGIEIATEESDEEEEPPANQHEVSTGEQPLSVLERNLDLSVRTAEQLLEGDETPEPGEPLLLGAPKRTPSRPAQQYLTDLEERLALDDE